MNWISMKEQRPEDGQSILYYFEPFGTLHIGTYDREYDNVHGKSGFTSVCPKVPAWCSASEIVENIPENLKVYFEKEKTK